MSLEYRIVPKNRYWWLLVLGLFFAAYDAFGIGSNDVANSVRECRARIIPVIETSRNTRHGSIGLT